MLNHIGTQTLHSERLILRPFRYTDDDDMLSYWVSIQVPNHYVIKKVMLHQRELFANAILLMRAHCAISFSWMGNT